MHTVESAEGLPPLPVDVLTHQGTSPKAQFRWTEIFHLSLTLSSSTWALRCKSFATVTNLNTGLRSGLFKKDITLDFECLVLRGTGGSCVSNRDTRQ